MKGAGKLVVLVLCFLAHPALGKGSITPLKPGTLMVSLDELSTGAAVGDDKFKSVCANLGRKLTLDHGVFGLGIFSEIKCSLTIPAASENLFWMKIRLDGDDVRFILGVSTSQNPFRELASVQIPLSDKLQEMMENESFSSLVAFALLDQMPMQIVFSGRKGKSKKHDLTAAEVKLLEDGIKVPESFYAFSASIDAQGIMYPNVIGTITHRKKNGKAKYLHETATAAGGSLTWILDSKGKKLPPLVFGLRSEGRSTQKENLQSIIDKRAQVVITEINQNLLLKSAKAVTSIVGKLGNSGYLGLRYGPALLAGDLIDKSKYFGALVEFRSGVLDGLRLYYDYWPEVKGTINGQAGTFGGKRAILAYSFSLKFESWIRKIDLTPKIGVWSFRSKAPIELEPGVYVSPEFEVKRSPSFDIELGIETGSSIHILRGWGSSAASFLSSANKNGAKISSNRVGMDLLLSPWGATTPVTVSLLSFYFFESVQLQKSQKVEGEDAELDQLNYSQAYAGGGIAVSW